MSASSVIVAMGDGCTEAARATTPVIHAPAATVFVCLFVMGQRSNQHSEALFNCAQSSTPLRETKRTCFAGERAL